MRRNVEVNIDDIVVTTKKYDNLITDLEETLANHQSFRIKLNPEQCVLGSVRVSS